MSDSKEARNKPTLFQKLFGRSKSSSGPSSPRTAEPSSKSDRRLLSASDAVERRRDKSPSTPSKPKASPLLAPPPARLQKQTSAPAGAQIQTKTTPPNSAVPQSKAAAPRKPPKSQAEAAGGGETKPAVGRQKSRNKDGGGARKKNLKHRKRNKKTPADIKVDPSVPVEYPATPEMILAHHKARPFLDKNEEWLLVELNEFECLVDSLEIIKIIAKHSKFFEVEPDELWEEFFEFVEEIPSYDEVINFDVWQEFRDNKYPC